MKIKSHFKDVDQLIAKVKAVTFRNKTRQAKVSAIGYPPQPIPSDGFNVVGAWSEIAMGAAVKQTSYCAHMSIKIAAWASL